MHANWLSCAQTTVVEEVFRFSTNSPSCQEDQYRSHVCMVNINPQQAAVYLSLPQRQKGETASQSKSTIFTFTFAADVLLRIRLLV